MLAGFEANAVALLSAFRGRPGVDVVETTDVTYAVTGIPVAAVNAVVRSALDPATADARIQAVRGDLVRT